MRWDPDAPSNIGPPPNGRAVHRQERTFSPGGPTGDVLHVVGVLGHPPHGIRTFEITQVLRDIGFDERDATGFAHLVNNL